MPLNDQDARALTYLACRLRKEVYGATTWDEHGTHSVIVKLVGRNLFTAVEEVVANAADATAKTPGSILTKRTPERPATDRYFPPKKSETCRIPGHEAYPASNCAGCRTAALVDEPVSSSVTPVADHRARAEACRVALRPGKEEGL